MIEIYFDGVLLDNQNYLAFDVSFQPFDKEFYLGSTGSINASLKIPKEALPASLNKVVIKLDGEEWYSCVVDSIEENDNEEYVITLMDVLTHTEVPYDFSDKVPISAKSLLENICNDFKIPHDEFEFTNQHVTISSYDSTVTAREYMGMIAELAGGYASIDREGKLQIKRYLKDTTNYFEKEDYIDVYFGSATYEDGIYRIKPNGTRNVYIDFNIALPPGNYVFTGAKDFTVQIRDDSTDVNLANDISNKPSFTITEAAPVLRFNYPSGTSTEEILLDTNNIMLRKEDISNIIKAEDVDTFKIKNTVTIERVVWQFVSEKKESSSDESLYTVYLDGNNLFLQNMGDEEFNQICRNIIGFTFSSIKINTTNKFFNDKEVMRFIDREDNEYDLLPFFEASYNGGFIGSYDSNLENGKQNETRVKNTSQRVKRIKQVVDQDSNTLKTTVEEINTQKTVTNPGFTELINANTTSIQQTAKSIRQEVSDKESALKDDIADVEESIGKTKEELEKLIEENMTSLELLSTSITGTVKSIGGNNLLRNSVGFAKSLNSNNIYELDFWKTTNPANISSSQDSDTESTTTSGSKIVFSNTGKLEQDFILQVGVTYGVSLKLKHIIKGGTANAVTIKILEGNTVLNVLNTSQQTQEYLNFTQLSEFKYKANTSNPKFVIESTGDDLIEISDLIVSSGDNQAWSSYFDEIYGKEHRLDKYGLKLTDLATNDYSHQTVNSLKFVDNGSVASEISQEQAKSDAGRFTNEITIRKLQWIALDDDNIIEYIS